MTPFLIAFVLALVATPVVLAFAHRWELIDVPNHRSSHAAPIPRGGGLAIVVASLPAVVWASSRSALTVGLAVGAVVLGVTGLIDDRRGLPPSVRLLVQVVTPAVVGLVVVDRSGLPLAAASVFGAVVIAGYVNAFNFMDGINGISGSQAAIAGAFLALVADHVGAASLAVAGWAVCGAAIGFLPYNAVRPSIFLGDVGSYFLGFWLAGLALLVVDAGGPGIVVVGPFLLYLLDTSSVLVRRARRGERLTEAHREHAYQLMTQAGWSHVAVTALCAAVSVVCAGVMFAVVDSPLGVQLVALVVCLGLVVGYLAVPGIVSRRRGIPDQVAA